MLCAQGRVARERGADGVQRVRFVSWEIKHSRHIEPEPEPEVPYLQRLWGPANAEELIALADAVAEDNRAAQAQKRTPAPAATPFVQVLLKAKADGHVRVYTHCLADGDDDDEDEVVVRGRRGRRPVVAPQVASLPEVAVPVLVAAKSGRRRPASDPRQAQFSF